MSWSAYSELKATGIKWLGQIPEHWAVDRIKWSVESSQNGIWGEEPDGGHDDIRCVRVADFDRPRLAIQDRDVTYRKVSESERRGRVLRNGDLILEKSGGGENNPVGFVVLYDRSDAAVTSNFVARMTLRSGMEPRFWTYLHSWLYNSRLTRRSLKQTSGIQNLDQQSYFDEAVCFPPSTDQVAIADFLDVETAKIDALIAKQEQLIATLREDRTATITHAVSMGLNPGADIVDSGVVWLGRMPRNWTHARLRDIIVSIDSGVSVNGSEVPAGPGEVGVLKTNSVTSGHGSFRPEANKTVLPEELFRVSCPVRAGTLIVNRANTADLVGSVGYVGEDVPDLYLSDLLWAVSVRTGVEPRFLHLWMQTPVYRTQIAAWRTGFNPSMQKLAKASLRAFVVALPPAMEQQKIVEYVEERATKIDSLTTKAAQVIETLREYRSALITDAVTGKIDVRGAA